MALTPGVRLGSYEIVAPLGAGGMGEVYRARDTQLQREVAIKILPELFATDPERRARFEREAQTLASLNHPHIAQIYGSLDLPSDSHSRGRTALVLELVEGETLAERLESGPLPLGEALTIARQVAAALEAAHERGFVHRDLKPANIVVTTAGQAKVLDFGLAKALAAPRGEDIERPTITSAMTAAGAVLGTAAYMSPEQARGKTIDQRSDVWAFGCVLFEMLTGRTAFVGETISDTIAAVLEREPDWRAVPPSTPSRIVWLLRRCLAKDRDQRLHDIADARIELDELRSQPAESSATITPGLGPIRRRERLWWAAAATVLAVLVVALALGRVRSGDRTAADARSYSTAIVLPDTLRLAPVNPPGRFALSPDGRYLAVSMSDASGRIMLWIRPLDSRVAQPLTGTEDAAFPFWSPDSRFIAFIAQNKLKKIPVAGGEVTTLADTAFNGTGTWNRDDVILFTPSGDAPVYRVTASGGTPAQVTALDVSAGEVQHSYPVFLPDGRHFLYFAVGSKTGGMTDPRGIYVASLDSREAGTLLVPAGSNARYADGHLIFVQRGTLLAQPFDVNRLTLGGQPKQLVEQVQVAGGATTGVAGSFSVSQTGVLIYQLGLMVRSQLTWQDRNGAVSGTLGDADDYADVTLSPDGSRVAVSIMDPSQNSRDIWVFDTVRGLRERFTFDPGDDFGPNWSLPGAERLVFSSLRKGSINLYERAANGSGSEPLLLADPLGKFNARFSPDGRYLVYVAGGGIISRSDIWVMPLFGDRKAFPFIDTKFVETHGQFSPDGRWLAYTSNESGVFEVYITSFPGKTGKWRVSAAGGGWPRWNRNGKEIFYLAPNNDLIAVPVTIDGSQLQLGAGRTLFATGVRPAARLDAYAYDVTADGQRFLVNRLTDRPTATPLTLIINWPAALPR